MAACIAFVGLALIACVAAGLTLLKMEPAVKNRSEKPVIGLEYMWLYVDFDKAAERAVYIIFWAYRQLSLALFRVGALEYEMKAAGRAIGPAKAGGPVLSLHIPSDALLTRESLDASYRAAKAFFARFFPDFHYQCAYCHSWIISPGLQPLLPPGSKILTFQQDFDILEMEPDSDSYRLWLFQTDETDPARFPEGTSLQCRAKAHLLAGGKLGEALGVLKMGLL